METTYQKVRRMFLHIFAAYGGAFLWVTFFVTVMRLMMAPSAIGTNFPPLSASLTLLATYFPELAAKVKADPALMLFMAIFFAPVTEEVLFRMLPLSFAQKHNDPRFTRAMVIAVCGIVFGLAHGNPMNVFIQGVVGLLLGWLYLKNDESQMTSYLSCVFVHAAYNFTVMMAG